MKIFGQHDEQTIVQFHDVRGRAVDAALMADGHVGYVMPIGGVAAYRDEVSVVGVGFDIACGNAAIRTDMTLSELGDTPLRVHEALSTLASEITDTVSFGIGRKNRADDAPLDHELFDDPAWSTVPPKHRQALLAKARQQLGTVGSGNHYVDVFADETGTLWIGVHFGSRGFGHTVASAFLALGQGKQWGERVPEREVLLGLEQPIGHDYWHLMNLAGRYAYAGREWVARKVASILGANEVELVHNHHNFCVPGDALIPTPGGPKLMAELRPGDSVYAFDATSGCVPTRITEHWQSGVKATTRIRTRGRSLRMTEEHPVLVVAVDRCPHPRRPWHSRSVGSLSWKRAGDVRLGDLLVCAEGFYAEDGGVGEGKARLAGAMLGDGWLRHDPRVQGYTVGLAIGRATESHTARYRELLETELPTATWHTDAPGTLGLTCSSLAVWRQVEALELGAYSRDKRVPAWAFRLPRREKLALLAGYLDSDGCVSKSTSSNHGRGVIASTNPLLVEDLRQIAVGCSLQVTNIRSKEAATNFGPAVIYRCVLSADAVCELGLWHETKARSVRHTRYRKSHHLEDAKTGYLRLPEGMFVQRVLCVEASHVLEPVFDLNVEHPSHTFVCDGVVVHNCWKEVHRVNGPDGSEDVELCVVRKGATPAFPGQKGFIGGSMGDDAVIVQGTTPDVASPEVQAVQRDALFSTVHGAGRIMSRTQAAGKRNRKTGQIIAPGRVTTEMMQAWVKEKGVILRGGGLDESPHVYRRLPEVLAAQEGTVEVLHTLRPLVVVMAGAEEFDPYKD